MTSKQIEIGDKILNILYEREGKTNNDNYFEPLHDEGYEYSEIYNALQSIESLALVEFNQKMLETRLLPKGYEAIEVGIQQYLKDQQKAADLEVKEKATNIKYVKLTFIVALLALLHSIFPVFNLIDLLGLKSPVNVDGNSESRHEQTQRAEPERLISPEQVNVVVKTLAHDSVLVKELAKELKRQQ
jgi:hypothetical protein